MTARRGYETKLRPDSPPAQDEPHTPPEAPPASLARLMTYAGPLGPMNAYITPDPKDGKKHPAVLWIHGGFGGLSPYLFDRDQAAENDQTVTPFLDAGLVVMCPGFRNHNDNPGKFEMFYGEVDDSLAAIDALAKLPYVDPHRIYVAGHSTGGTMTLLIAEAADKVRAAFSIAGSPDLAETVATAENHSNAPYDWSDATENRLRSATQFVARLKTPLWFFDGVDSFYAHQAGEMKHHSQATGAPFHAIILDPATHYDQVRPLNRLIAAKILADTGETCGIAFKPEEIAAAFADVFPGRSESARELLPTLSDVHVTRQAGRVFLWACTQHKMHAEQTALRLEDVGGNPTIRNVEPLPKNLATDKFDIGLADGVYILADKGVLAKFKPFTVAMTLHDRAIGYQIVRGDHPTINEPALNWKSN